MATKLERELRDELQRMAERKDDVPQNVRDELAVQCLVYAAIAILSYRVAPYPQLDGTPGLSDIARQVGNLALKMKIPDDVRVSIENVVILRVAKAFGIVA